MLISSEERERLSRQCQKILEGLRLGRMSNRELAGISFKYTSRISDLRQAGYQIECVDHDRRTGLTHYELIDHLPAEISS